MRRRRELSKRVDAKFQEYSEDAGFHKESRLGHDLQSYAITRDHNFTLIL